MTRGRAAIGPLLLLVVVCVGSGVVIHECVAPLDEVIESVAASEVQVLDEAPPTTRARSAPRVLVFALDGVGRDSFSALLESEGRLSELTGEAGEEDEARRTYAHACELRDALSILPSTTIAAWTSTLTGEPIAQTGIAGNEWFIREEARFVAPAPVSVSGHRDTLSTLNDGLLGDLVAVETVYERTPGRSHASLIPLYRGADVFTVPDAAALSGLFGAFVDGLTETAAFERAIYGEADEACVDSVVEALTVHGVPTLQVIYFPGIDLFTHGASDPLEDQRAYLREVTAPLVERVLSFYEQAGVLDDTTVIFVSDHGHTPVLNDDRHALSIEGDDEPPAVLESLGFRVRSPTLEAETTDFSAVVAYQGAIAYLYLADRTTCPNEGDPCDWQRPPRFAEDVLAVARGFADASRSSASLGGLSGALDMVFARQTSEANEERGYSVLDERGELISVEHYLQQHPRPEFLRLADRVRAMSEGPHGDRVGDVMLLARGGAHEAIEDRYYFSSPYRSWHGGPTASDSRVTFFVASPARTGAELCADVDEVTGSAPSQRHLTPLVERLLSP